MAQVLWDSNKNTGRELEASGGANSYGDRKAWAGVVDSGALPVSTESESGDDKRNRFLNGPGSVANVGVVPFDQKRHIPRP